MTCIEHLKRWSCLLVFQMSTKSVGSASTRSAVSPADLLNAVKSFDLLFLQDILQDGAVDTNYIDEDSCTALFYAAQQGFTLAVEELLEHGADPNVSRSNSGNYPILAASAKGFSDVVQLLIRKKVNVNVEDQYGSTALQLACMNGHTDVVRVLLDAKADADCTDKDQMRPIHRAVDREEVEIVRLLVRAKANVNVVDKYGNTPLLWATTKGHLAIIQILIDADADVNYKNEYGETPLAIAEDAEVKRCLSSRLPPGGITALPS